MSRLWRCKHMKQWQWLQDQEMGQMRRCKGQYSYCTHKARHWHRFTRTCAYWVQWTCDEQGASFHVVHSISKWLNQSDRWTTSMKTKNINAGWHPLCGRPYPWGQMCENIWNCGTTQDLNNKTAWSCSWCCRCMCIVSERSSVNTTHKHINRASNCL
jgi:hypothetical protein